MPVVFDQPEKDRKPSAKKAPTLQSIAQKPKAEQQSVGIFSAYIEHPKGVTFVNQEDDEIVILFLRRHFVTNVPWITYTILLFLVPPVFFALLRLSNISISGFPQGLIVSVIAFYYLIVLGFAFGKFVSWFYNIGLVTNKRIVDLDSSNILSHNTSTANFNEIVDVKFLQRGFFQSFFDYGDVQIQTEALHANFEFDAAPKPAKVENIISDLRAAMKGEKNGTS